jgi:hypothetical protein
MGNYLMDISTLIRILARKVALAADTGQKSVLSPLRAEVGQLVTGLDGDDVDRASPAFRFGAYDALGRVISALEDQMLSEETCNMLLGSKHYVRILEAVREYPGESQTSNDIDDLLREGLVILSPTAERGRTYSLTGWGQKALEFALRRQKQLEPGVSGADQPPVEGQHPHEGAAEDEPVNVADQYGADEISRVWYGGPETTPAATGAHRRGA